VSRTFIIQKNSPSITSLLLLLSTLIPVFSSHASGPKAPAKKLAQNITCFAFTELVTIDSKPIDIKRIDPLLLIRLESKNQIGEITVRRNSSHEKFRGAFNSLSAQGTVALKANTSATAYTKHNINTVKITLHTEPSPNPSIDIFVPSTDEILQHNLDFNNAPYITKALYTEKSLNTRTASLSAICYAAQAR
jgi:hypothetical protein